MEESQLQALADTLAQQSGRKGLGSSQQYSWTKSSRVEPGQQTEREDGLPSNVLYSNFVKEGRYDPNARIDDGDGRTIKRDFSDIPILDSKSSEADHNETPKARRKAAKKAAKLEAKRLLKLEEKRKARREAKRSRRELRDKENGQASTTLDTSMDRKKRKRGGDSWKSGEETSEKLPKKERKRDPKECTANGERKRDLSERKEGKEANERVEKDHTLQRETGSGKHLAHKRKKKEKRERHGNEKEGRKKKHN